ncbi:MAG: hypothetical protein H0U10_00750, partial [Chloroflexia bacterium]|nr:hypothetical protein [Chloroflexia bacterium]
MTEARRRNVHLVVLVASLAAAGLAVVLVRRAASLAAGRSVLETGPPAAEALLLAVVALMLLAVAVFRPERLRMRGLKQTTAAWTLTLVVGILGLWQVVHREFELDALHGTTVTSAAEADAFLAAHPPPNAPGYRIPTGLFLQQFEFLSGDNVLVSGYVWQRYADAIPAEIERAVVFPESIDTEVFEEAYRSDLGDALLIRWYFEVTLRQVFDYTRYPLDRQDVWFRLWSPSADLGAVLVPDFASYEEIDPAALPGIERDIVSGSWTPYLSGFSYNLHSNSTRFGQVDTPFRHQAPELYFNLDIKRDYRGPLLKHLPFTLAIAGLLFGIMLLGTSDPDLRSRFGFQTLAVIATTGALLLTVVVEHNGIRDTVSAGQVSYIEALPFTLYGLILLVTVNAIIRDRPDAPAFFDDRNNIW